MMAEVLLGDRLVFNGSALSRWRGDDSVQAQLSREVAAIGAETGIGDAELWRLVDRCLRCDSVARPTFVEVSALLGECRSRRKQAGAAGSSSDVVASDVVGEPVVSDGSSTGCRSYRLISPLASVRSRLPSYTPPRVYDQTRTVTVHGASTSSTRSVDVDGVAAESGWFGSDVSALDIAAASQLEGFGNDVSSLL